MLSFEVDGARIRYEQHGTGNEVVILVHCSAGTRRQWTALTEKLSPNYTVLSYDLPGYGESTPWPGRSALSLKREASVVQELRRRFSGPTHLIGHSFGGAIALQAAVEQPNAFSSLTLIEPVAFHLLADGTPQDVTLYENVRTLASSMVSAMAAGDLWDGAKHFIEYWNGTGAWGGMEERARDKLAALTGRIVTDFSAVFANDLSLAYYRRIHCPTRLIRGEKTKRSTYRIIDRLMTVLPNVEVAEIPGAGHMAPLTHPRVVNAVIENQINRHGYLAKLAA